MRFGVALVALVVLGCTEHAPLDVATVDLERFQGGWYELMKLPRPTQAGCAGTVAFYRRTSDTELDFYSECREGSLDGPVRRMAARAVVTDPAEPAKLSLDFGGFFGDYWIVERDAEYRYAAVGHPSRDYLWILSRAPAMAEADLDALRERLRAKGFDEGRLEWTLQAPEGESPLFSSETVPSPGDHGCSLAPVRANTRGGFVLFGVLAFGIFGARRRRRW